jgi:hypothetical protein
MTQPLGPNQEIIHGLTIGMTLSERMSLAANILNVECGAYTIGEMLLSMLTPATKNTLRKALDRETPSVTITIEEPKKPKPFGDVFRQEDASTPLTRQDTIYVPDSLVRSVFQPHPGVVGGYKFEGHRECLKALLTAFRDMVLDA